LLFRNADRQSLIARQQSSNADRQRAIADQHFTNTSQQKGIASEHLEKTDNISKTLKSKSPLLTSIRRLLGNFLEKSCLRRAISAD
jgi:hypothetical protein